MKNKKSQVQAIVFFIAIIWFIIFVILNERNQLSPLYNESKVNCNEITKKICYRYYSKGGIFSGVEEVKVGCDSQHDFQKHIFDGDDCYYNLKYVYENITNKGK